MNPDIVTTLLYAAISSLQDKKVAEAEVTHEFEDHQAETSERITVVVRDEVKEYGPVFVRGEAVDEEEG